MRLGVRTKLFLISLGLFIIVGLASGLYLQRTLRDWSRNQLQNDLEHTAALLRDAFELAAYDLEPQAVTPLATRLAASSSVRVTIYAAGGAILGDSTPGAVAPLAPGASLPPDVQAALSGQRGFLEQDDGVSDPMFYVSLPFANRGRQAVLRAGVAQAEVSAALGRLYLLMGVAATIGLGIAVLMSGLASHFLWRELRTLVDSARGMAEGGSGRRIPVSRADELGLLAGSLNRMAEEIERTVAALRTERDRFQSVLETMREAVIALDPAERITIVNGAATSLLDLPASPIGRTLLETVRVPILEDMVHLCARGTPVDTEFELPGKPTRMVAARAMPLPGHAGTLIVLNDVTAVRHLETVRRDFVANVSHELRTPVSVIQATAETLADGALNDPARVTGFLDALSRNAERLSRIITDLLDISRIEAGRYPLEIAPMEPGPLISKVVTALGTAIQEKNLSVAVDLAPGIQVLADVKALDHVLTNLVENAVKYTSSGGHVVVRALVQSGRARFEVRDDGPGIPPRHRARIFERFYRVDPGRSREMGGTGLGLAIVKHLVEAMGGAAGVEPVVPHGCNFFFELPAPVGSS